MITGGRGAGGTSLGKFRRRDVARADAVKLALGPHRHGCPWYQVKGKSRLYVPAAAR